MVRRSVVGTGVVAMLASGCYMDLAMGAHHAGGGVSGFGWELVLTGGVAYDIAGALRPGVGMGASMTRVSAEDGKFGTTGLAYHGRADVTISAPEQIASADIAAAHPGMEIPEGGATARTRLVLDYALGTYETLQFIAPDDPMTYKHKSTTHAVYLGLAREYDVSSVQASFSIGPSVTFMPNDFVGDTTAIGAQFHSSFWFVPVFRPRKSGGGLLDHYTPSDPIKPLPTAPDPVRCVDRWGHSVPC